MTTEQTKQHEARFQHEGREYDIFRIEELTFQIFLRDGEEQVAMGKFAFASEPEPQQLVDAAVATLAA